MEVPPGLLTRSTSDAVNDAIRQSEETREELERMRRKLPAEFAAAITSYDGATGSCGWKLRGYNSNGLRIDHNSGLTGSPTWMPAYPVGNGEMPPPSFPVDVWLRTRLRTSDKGPVYEFDWICGCSAEGSGSGSGGGGVETDCCPNPIPTTLTMTITSACAEVAGTHSLTWLSGTTWQGTIGATDWLVTLTCSGGTWTMTISQDLAPLCEIVSEFGAYDESCDPFSVSFDFLANAECIFCPEIPLTIVVTE